MTATPDLEATIVAPPPAIAGPAVGVPVPFPALPAGPTPVPARPVRRPRSAAVRPLFPADPSLFPWLARRFAPGEGTLWSGPPRVVETLLRDVLAGAVAAGGRVSLLEGANRFDPYRVVERGRRLGVAPDPLLEGIRLARAFTVHQLAALAETWHREVRRHRPTLLVAHEMPALFDDPDVDPDERRPLLLAVAEGLRTATEAARVPLLVTSTNGLAGFPGLAERGPRLYDWVRCRPAPGRVLLTSHRIREQLRLVVRPDGQAGLEAFGGIPDGEEVMAWDAPSRPTGRRWRSG